MSNELKRLINTPEYSSMTNVDLVPVLQAIENIEETYKISAGVARGYLVSVGAWHQLKEIQSDKTHPKYDELFGIADATMITATETVSYFGVNINTDTGRINHDAIDTMVANGIKLIKSDFLNLSKKITYPYKGVTEFDIAMARSSGNQESHTTNYANGGEFHVKLPLQDIKVFVYLDKVSEYDTTHSLYSWERPDSGSEFVKHIQPAAKVTIPAGEIGIMTRMRKSFTEHVKFSATSNILEPFSITVIGA